MVAKRALYSTLVVLSFPNKVARWYKPWATLPRGTNYLGTCLPNWEIYLNE